MSMFDLKDRVVVITGGYGVLGASMARCLAEQGAHIVVVGRKADKGETLAAELSALGAEALFCKADVTAISPTSSLPARRIRPKNLVDSSVIQHSPSDCEDPG